MRLLSAVLGFSFFAATGLAATGIAPGPILSSAPSQFVTSDGARVHYKVVGHGKATIVFLHGLGGDLNVWREQVSALQSKARLILIDLPGHGLSDPPDVYSMRTFARAVSVVLKQTRTENAILVGHSISALIAREVDRTFPAHCRGIVAVDGMLRNPFPDPEEGAKFVAGFQGEGGDARLGAFFDGMLTAAPAPLHEEIRAAAIAVPRAVVVGTLSASFPPDVWTGEKVSVPLYAIVTRTPHTDDSYVQFLHTLGNDVTVDIIDHTDHFLMLDAAGELNARLETWLTAHKWIR